MPLFSRNKSKLEIPPANNDSARNELLGSRGGSRGRSVSPQPPPSYRTTPPSLYGDEDPYFPRSPKQDPYSRAPTGSAPSGPSPLPDRYNRAAVGDPYARGGNVEADRAQLFSGYDPTKRKGGNMFDDRADRFGTPGGATGDEPRQFQTQEEEDEDVEGIKQQTRFVKQESVNSTRNALRIAREAEETAGNTLAKLGDQSEKLANTERHVDMSKVHALRAEDRTDELKKLNRSIFRPAITFNKDQKRAQQEAKIKSRYDEQQHEREKAMSDVRATQNRIGRAYASNVDGDEDEGIGGHRHPSSEARKQWKRYQFEATASDDELEGEIGDNLDSIGSAVKNLKSLALAAGDELDSQNARIDNIASKTSKLNYNVDTTTARLRNIK